MFQFPYFHQVSYRDGMPPNIHKCKLKQNIKTFNSISKVMTTPSTTNQSTHLFFALQFHMHGCTILGAHLCWQSYILGGKCIHVWECVGWCKWSFAQVGDTHLPGATFFLHLAGLAQVHQPLHTLALANDFQVWWLEHIFEVCWHMYTFSEVFDSMSYLIQFCIWCVWNLQLVLFLMVLLT